MLGLIVPLAVILYLIQAVTAVNGPIYNHHYGVGEDNFNLFANVGSYLEDPTAASQDFVPASYVYALLHGQAATHDYHWHLLKGKHPQGSEPDQPKVCAEADLTRWTREPLELRKWWKEQQARDGGRYVRTMTGGVVHEETVEVDESSTPPHHAKDKRAFDFASFMDPLGYIERHYGATKRAPHSPTRSQDLDSALHGTNVAGIRHKMQHGRASHNMVVERRRAAAEEAATKDEKEKMCEDYKHSNGSHAKHASYCHTNATTPNTNSKTNPNSNSTSSSSSSSSISHSNTTSTNSTTSTSNDTTPHTVGTSIKGGPSDLKPYVPAPPRWNGYACCALTDYLGNLTNEMPSTRELVGMNVLTLAFLTSNTSSFRAQKFFNYSVPERRRIVDLYHSKGISLFLSTFGGDPNEQPVTQNFNPTMLGDLHGEIAYKSGFDGLDNDIEDFEAFSWHNKSLVTWVSMYTEAVRRWLPASGGFGVSAAPVAPWFTPNRTTYCHGAYDGIDKQVGHLYDFYNVQFYNQGVGSYDDCKNLLFKSNLTAFPQTSIFEIARNGVPLDKLLIAKPGYPVDAASGYVPPEKLSYCLHLAKNNGWKAGAASWQFPHASTQWWRELRMDSFYDESLFAKRPID